MAKDYTVISRKIVEQIGGIDNIANVTHCMTRLRFVLKDETLADDEAVKAIDGVMGLVKQGGQYQIIIGNHVGTAYQEVLKLGNFGEQSEIAKGEKKEPLTLKKWEITFWMRLWEHVPADSGYHRRLHGKASGYAPWNGRYPVC